MIKSREDLKEYLHRDMAIYRSQSRRDRFLCRLTRDPLYELFRYVKLLRYEEYYFNCGRGKLGTLAYLYCFRKKNRLGNRLGVKIPKNCFGPGLTIYHHGLIIVNENSRIGEDCSLHGGNCIGNNGKDSAAPRAGDGLDLGFGAQLIGDVQLGDRVRVGANAVVTRSFEDSGITLVGIPACQKNGRETQ